MFSGKQIVGWVAVVAASLFLVVSAVRYNLTAVSALTAQQPVTVAIDAGHGGEDGGAVSADGTKESGINLSSSLRLEQLLAFCGMEPTMIRREDVWVGETGNSISEKKISDLKRRVQMVQGIPNPVLVSIHQNHFPQQQYHGAQVFYGKTTSSAQLAQQIQDALRQTLDPSNHRQCKAADTVYLLQKVSCPAVLIECGFLSNVQEAAWLQTDEYQKKLICAVASALSQFLENEGNEFEI